MKAEVKGEFQKANKEYLDWVTSISLGRAQASPFIVLPNQTLPGLKDRIIEVSVIEHMGTLFEEFEEDITVLQAWPGQWRTNVFKSTVGEIKRHFHQTK